jgi:hypothetical protein
MNKSLLPYIPPIISHDLGWEYEPAKIGFFFWKLNAISFCVSLYRLEDETRISSFSYQLHAYFPSFTLFLKESMINNSYGYVYN